MKAYTLGLYEKAMPGDLSWRDKLIAAKEAGFDFLELSIDETEDKLRRLDMTKEERHSLMEVIDEIGMPIRSMCLSGHRKYPLGSEDPIIRAKSLEIMEKAIRLADYLGIRIIMLAGYDVYYEKSTEETKKRFFENLKISVEMAASYGITLGFETMETEFMNTVKKAMEYVRLINSSYLSVYPDIGNITNAAKLYSSDVLADIDSGRGHLLAMHLKETVPGKFRDIPFGTGHVNFEDAIEKSWSLGVRRYVTEFWYKGSPLWKQDLSRINKMMSEILDKQL